jgi:hypothetical protein
MPVGLALPLGSADHCVVRSRVWDREHNAICAKSFLRPGTLRQGMGAWCARLRPSSPEGHDATRQLHAYAARARALSLRSTVVALSGPGLHDVGADLADPRAYVALHRL